MLIFRNNSTPRGRRTPPFAKGGTIPASPTRMYYVYLLRSEKDKGFYIGFTTRDVRERLVEHQNGIVDSTKNRQPIELIYFEAYTNESQARERELKLKDFGSSYTGLLKRLGFK